MNGVPLPRLRSRKGLSLLALLALRHGAPVERTMLAGLLWPDRPTSQALETLRRDLTDLRRALGAEADRLFSPTSRSLCLDLVGASVDVADFDRAIARGDPAMLEEAVALYCGPLLEGCGEEWVFQERREREEAYLGALERLGTRAMAAEEWVEAQHYLRQAVAVDPLRETAQRALMQALAAGGNYAAALLAYRELGTRLHREINAEPDAETRALFQQLRSAARAKAASGKVRVTETIRDSTERLAPSGVPAGLPPLGSPRGVPNNLPLQLTSFVGREDQIAEIEQWLAPTRFAGNSRLVTLTGAGGCGKTRLALEVAAQILEEYPEGVWLVELAPLADPALVPQAVATALGVRESPGQSLSQTLMEYLRPRHLLLVLDNCEHLVGACALLAETLLQSCPDLRILATSREALAGGGERAYRVPSLSLPEARLPSGRGGADLASTSSQYEAVRLFIERATTAQPAFRLTEANAPVVAEVCRRLDGIPLAIELAAARAKVLAVEQLAQRLDDILRLLTIGNRTAPPRHQTLRALIDWSCALLSEPERILLRRLSVFAGGWTLEAAEGVGSGQWTVSSNVHSTEQDGPDSVGLPTVHCLLSTDVLDLLTMLVDKSLVQCEVREEHVRYRLLEAVRQYGRERLLEAREDELLRARHRDWFLSLAEQAGPKAMGAERREWAARLEAEHDNLRAALGWSIARADAAGGLRFCAALWPFWRWRGYWEEGRKSLAQVLALVGAEPQTEALARVLLGAGALAHDHGDYEEARVLLSESLAMGRALGNKVIVGSALNSLAEVVLNQGEQDLARSLAQESLAMARESGE